MASWRALLSASPMLFRDFPVDYDARHDLVHTLRLDVATVERSVFLDNRIDADLAAATVLARAAMPPVAPESRAAILLHTSFCGSTLLAKALHDRERRIALREPLVFRRLADAHHNGQAMGAALADLTCRVVQPWSNGAAVLVKPTHVALPIASGLLDALPQAPVLALTSSLEDFLLSNLRKPAETQARTGELVARQSRGNPLDLRTLALPREPDFLDIVALQWSLQREWLAAVQRRFPGRMKVVDASALYARPVATLVAGSAWLGDPLDETGAAARLQPLLGVHAKAPHLAYDAATRESHNAMVREACGPALRAALDRWAAVVAPAMGPDTLDWLDA